MKKITYPITKKTEFFDYISYDNLKLQTKNRQSVVALILIKGIKKVSQFGAIHCCCHSTC